MDEVLGFEKADKLKVKGDFALQVILLQDVNNLGRSGEIKQVKEGYAINFLIPRGLAEEATSVKIKRIQQQKDMVQRKKTKEKQLALKVAEKLKEVGSISLAARQGESGRLFGSVTAADIVEVINARGFKIDKRKIELEQQIKTLGSYQVTVKLYPEVAVTLEVVVEAESSL